MATRETRDNKVTSRFETYVAGLDDARRAGLEAMRAIILAALPKTVEERMSYGMPAFVLDGNLVAGLSASAKHLSYHPMSGAVVDVLKDDLVGYSTSKGTIRFPIDKPLPVALVKKLLKARLAEIR